MTPEDRLRDGWQALNEVLWKADTAAALSHIGSFSDSTIPGEISTLANHQIWHRDLTAARRTAERLPDFVIGQGHYTPREYWLAEIALASGDSAGADALYATALEKLTPLLETRPDDPRVHCWLGTLLARLGQLERAVEHGERAIELAPADEDFLAWGRHTAHMVRTLSIAGETERAFELAERLLPVDGSRLSIASMEVTPGFEAMLEDPRWPALAREYGPRQ